MRFELSQHIAAPPDAVAEAFTDPDYYDALAGLPKLGAPEVLAMSAEDDLVRVEVRYRFAGDLSPAARAVLDPARLTWVEISDHDLARRRSTFVLKPDHYADRFSCRGRTRVDADPNDPSASVRRMQGEMKVRAPLVAGQVERAIVSGLEEHFAAEAKLLSVFLNE